VKKYTDGKKEIEAELEQLKRHCCVIRVLAHTQVCIEAILPCTAAAAPSLQHATIWP